MVSIRTYREDDLPALKAMVADLHEALRAMVPDLPPAPEIIDAYFAYLCERIGETQGTFLLAEDDGTPVGYLCLFGLVPPATVDEHPGPYAVVSDLYVAPVAQGQGVGARLLAEAEARARALDAADIRLTVFAANTPARGFYHRVGYGERYVVMTKRL